MKGRIFTAALLAALCLTACGKAVTEDDSVKSTTEKSVSSTAAVTEKEEASSAAEDKDSKAEESSKAEEEESSAEEKQTEAPESKPEKPESKADKNVTETAAPEEPVPEESEVETVQGRGYNFELDKSRWVDAMGNSTITQIDNGQQGIDPSIEFIYGWLGDKKSTCVISEKALNIDTTGYDINELGSMFAEDENIPEGQQLISWNVQEINGLNWIRLEYSLSDSIMGFNARSLVYICFVGTEQYTLSFSIPEESVSDIDDDLRALMWSVKIE